MDEIERIFTELENPPGHSKTDVEKAEVKKTFVDWITRAKSPKEMAGVVTKMFVLSALATLCCLPPKVRQAWLDDFMFAVKEDIEKNIRSTQEEQE